MSLSKKFLPKKEILENLSYRDQKKISDLLTGDVICFIMFSIFAVGLLALGKMVTGVCMIFMCITFVFSMLTVKKGHMVFGSYMTSAGLCIACVIVTFLTSHVSHPVVCYRTVCFCCAISCLNYMISLKKGQLYLFMVVSIILLISSTFVLHFPEEFMQDPKEWISSILINILAIACSSCLLIASNNSNEQVVKHSEKEHEQVSKTLETITNVLNQVKESMNVGQKLEGAADAASTSVSSIQDVYQSLITETDKLDRQAMNIKAASDVVNQRSAVMSNSILEQNNSISEISSAITQISANISQIDTIAEKRREGMEEANQLLLSQNNLIKKIVEDVDKVQESSDRIAEFVNTVDKIAQQTNLLAMNASIEAAHSGEHGKGFSVIAQEIRKLSEETTNNAKRISETLEQNSVVVNETSESVAAFAEANKKSETEIRQTFESMEEILHGIGEMDTGTREIMNSVNKVVDVSQENAKIIDEVVGQISTQTADIESVTSTTTSLKERVGSISQMLPQISSAMEQVHNSALENEEVSERIAELLK